MIEFSVMLSNRPGQLATLSRELATAGVNIETLAAFTSGGEGYVKLVADNDLGVRRVLDAAGTKFEERRVINVMLTDKPGALADMAEALAKTGVNVEAMYLINSSAEGLEFAVAVDDTDSANAQL